MFGENISSPRQEGAFASLVTYPAALINNPRKGSDDDHVWAVNKKAVPPVETPSKSPSQLEPATESETHAKP